MKSMLKSQILKILIAEDDPDDRQLLALAFKEAKLMHRVDFVTNGEQLMEYLMPLAMNEKRDQVPDLILLDLNMPKKDGRAALGEIRSNPYLNKLNIIIFSTSISKEDYLFVYRLGVLNCITKPCGFNELVEIVKNICRQINPIISENKI
ncbi:MAG: response regulator [Bacteroidetes bacterium]|nr:response regulator [Bacteroidota bacterium]